MTMTQNDLFTLKNPHYQKVRVKVCNHPFTLNFLHYIFIIQRQCRNGKNHIQKSRLSLKSVHEKESKSLKIYNVLLNFHMWGS